MSSRKKNEILNKCCLILDIVFDFDEEVSRRIHHSPLIGVTVYICFLQRCINIGDSVASSITDMKTR